MDFVTELKNAEFIVGVLRAAGYDAYIVGGALRKVVLGGETGDIDIAVLVDGQREGQLLHADTGIVLRKLGHDFRLKNQSEYSNNTAFIADWRTEHINLIAYDTKYVKDIDDLVDHFDLNINSWYVNAEGNIINNNYDTTTKVVKSLNKDPTKCGRLRKERLTRFKAMFPDLVWEVDDAEAIS